MVSDQNRLSANTFLILCRQVIQQLTELIDINSSLRSRHLEDDAFFGTAEYKIFLILFR